MTDAAIRAVSLCLLIAWCLNAEAAVTSSDAAQTASGTSATVTTATLTIEVPQNFCELDKISDCSSGQCIRYDPKKFVRSPSIVAYSAHSRFGSLIIGYLMIFWTHLHHGMLPFVDRNGYEVLQIFFTSLGPVRILEDSLCNVRDFPFEWFKGTISQLADPSYKMGRALEFALDRDSTERQVHEMFKYFRMYPKETSQALHFVTRFSRYAEVSLRRVAKSKDVRPSQLTFVGVHDRRRPDFLAYRKNVLHKEDLDPDYLADAMDNFREEYKNAVFVYVSDDMTWAKEHLDNQHDVFLLGCNKPFDPECLGRDLALLAACNHTILTHGGAFGLVAAFMAGGDIYTEHGPLVPDSY